jgi:LicD family
MLRLMLYVIVSFTVITVSMYAYTKHPQVVFPVESYFVPPMSENDSAILKRTLDALVEVLNRINVTYFMTSGTLLGSYRHHGRIPWDDDVDLIVNRTDKMRVRDALLSCGPEYELYTLGWRWDDNQHWKFYSAAGQKVPLRSYRWPYVDLLFFREDAEYVWNESPWFTDERWPRSAVFPLVRRPFEGLWLPAPCDTASVLAVNFRKPTEHCASRARTHSYDVPFVSSIVIPCNSTHLRHFPFVSRSTTTASGANTLQLGLREEVESLTMDDRTLKTTIVRSGCQP